MTRTDIDTGTEDCLAHEADGIEVITLNRPQARNALTDAMKDGIGVALDYAARSHSVRSVVVTGAGGAFCAGGDVKQMAAGRDEDGTLDERIYEQRLDHRKTAGRMYAMPKPVIAMIPGPAAGAGLSIALWLPICAPWQPVRLLPLRLLGWGLVGTTAVLGFFIIW